MQLDKYPNLLILLDFIKSASLVAIVNLVFRGGAYMMYYTNQFLLTTDKAEDAETYLPFSLIRVLITITDVATIGHLMISSVFSIIKFARAQYKTALGGEE